MTDKTTKKNIIWATESYKHLGTKYGPKQTINKAQITGKNGRIIQPRAAKSLNEQKLRKQIKAEVFTPIEIVKKMNSSLDDLSTSYPVTRSNWLDYIAETRLEVSCGEAPFIVTRYNVTSKSGLLINPKNRVGFLDSKLKYVNKFANSIPEWLEFAEIALKSSYGFEWQGDNLLIARENVLLTLEDFFREKFQGGQQLTTQNLEKFAEIISWNIFQMDGLKLVVPMSCKNEIRIIAPELTLFGETEGSEVKYICKGCETGDAFSHTGKKVKIMDWVEEKEIYFINCFP